jgi:general secretion pathway protein B
MSYILDALKKSEKERQRGKSPDLLTIQDTIPQEIKKRPMIKYLIVTALLLNALFLMFWFKPNQSKNTAAVSMPAEELRPAGKGEEIAPQPAKTAEKEVSVEKHSAPSAERVAVEKAPVADSSVVKKRPVQERFDLVPALAPRQSAVAARVPS